MISFCRARLYEREYYRRREKELENSGMDEFERKALIAEELEMMELWAEFGLDEP